MHINVKRCLVVLIFLALLIPPASTNGPVSAAPAAGVTELVSVSTSGEQANGRSELPSISADGRFVAFPSWASNLVSGDTNGWEDIFVHDRQTGVTERVSVSTSGEQGNDWSENPSISADGRFVAFDSRASNLVSVDTNDTFDIFVHDRQTGVTERVSVSTSGEQGNGLSGYPSISADGRFVAFESWASNLVSGDTNGWEDIFVRDRCTGGVCEDGNGEELTYTISGRVVDHRDQPLSGVTIQTSSAQTVTGADGSFSLLGLPAGEHLLTLSKSGYTFVPVSASNFVVRLPSSKSNLVFVGTPLPTNCEPPFFSQRDARWSNHPLRTSGSCKAECGTIGACGCTLTSAAMLFSYYGADGGDLTPPELSDCMGNTACPFTWGTSCHQVKARFIPKMAFSYAELDRQLNQYHRPVILKMEKGEETHWVLVTSGSGNKPENYRMHDPLYINGRNQPLVDRLNDGWKFTEMAVYDGQPACGSGNASAQFANLTSQAAETPPGVSGTVMVYRREGPTLYVQFHAHSEFGSITEMKVWSEGEREEDAAWQPYDGLIQMPVAERVYTRFRDEHGNQSEVYSDSINPQFSPPDSEVFFPVYLPLLNRDVRSPIGD